MKKPKHGRQRADQSNQTHVLLAVDRQNSVLAELNNSDLNTVRYSAYGQRSAELNPAASVAFNGEFREPDTGWYLLGNGYRAYNPVLRRFHSPDSLSPFESGGLNAYAYCVGDPINRTDPTGHFAFSALLSPKLLFSFGTVGMLASLATIVAAQYSSDDKRATLTIAGATTAVVSLGLLGAGVFRAMSAVPRLRSSLNTTRQNNAKLIIRHREDLKTIKNYKQELGANENKLESLVNMNRQTPGGSALLERWKKNIAEVPAKPGSQLQQSRQKPSFQERFRKHIPLFKPIDSFQKPRVDAIRSSEA